MKKHMKYLMIASASLLVLTACTANETPVQITPPEASAAVDTVLIGAKVDDFSHLRTPYVGAAHATHAVVAALPLPGENWAVASIQIGADHGDFAEGYSPYTLTIFYEPQQGSVIAGTSDNLEIPQDAFISNSGLLFELIENLQAVHFSVRFSNDVNNIVNDDFFDYRWGRSRFGEYSLTVSIG